MIPNNWLGTQYLSWYGLFLKSPILLIPWQDIKEVSSFVYIKTVEFMARYFKTTGNDFHKFHEDVIKLLDECCITSGTVNC